MHVEGKNLQKALCIVCAWKQHILVWCLIHPESICDGVFLSLTLSNLCYPSQLASASRPLRQTQRLDLILCFISCFSFLLSVSRFPLEADSPKCHPCGVLPALSGLADGERGIVPKDSLAQARIIPLTRSRSGTVTWIETRETDLSLASLSLPLAGPFSALVCMLPVSLLCARETARMHMAGTDGNPDYRWCIFLSRCFSRHTWSLCAEKLQKRREYYCSADAFALKKSSTEGSVIKCWSDGWDTVMR